MKSYHIHKLFIVILLVQLNLDEDQWGSETSLGLIIEECDVLLINIGTSRNRVNGESPI